MVVAACMVAGLGPALLLTWLVSRLSPKLREAYASSANAATIGTVSLLFGLFAAFLANDIWVRNQTARQAVIEEGDAIRTWPGCQKARTSSTHRAAQRVGRLCQGRDRSGLAADGAGQAIPRSPGQGAHHLQSDRVRAGR